MDWRELSLREQVFQLMAPSNDQLHRRKIKDYEAYMKENPYGFIYREGGMADPSERIGGKERTDGYDYLPVIKNFIKTPVCICADNAKTLVEMNLGEIAYRYDGMYLGAADDEELAVRGGKVYAMQALCCGIDWLFNPNCDIVQNPMSHSVGSVGGFPELNARIANGFIKGVQSMNMAACAKHFPGMGTSYTNFHMSKAYNYLTKEEWDETYGKMYQSIIDNGVMTIMTSHLALPAYQTPDENGEYPMATYSEELTIGLLKKQLGFKGVVVTDALIMGGCSIADPVKTAVEAFKAGADVLLMPTEKAPDAIVAALESGEIPMSRLEDALERIWWLKTKLGIFDENRVRPKADPEFIKAYYNDVLEKGITVLQKKGAAFPIDKKKVKKILVVGACSELTKCKFELLCDALKKEGFEVDFREYLGTAFQYEMDAIQDNYDLMLVVFCTDVPGGAPVMVGKQLETVWSIHKIKPEKKCVLVFGSAMMYEVYFKDEPVVVQNYNLGITPMAVEKTVDILMGRVKPQGKLPIPTNLLGKAR